MQSESQKLTLFLISGALAALQSAAAEGAPTSPEIPVDATIAAISDVRQLSAELDTKDIVEQSRNDVDHGAQDTMAEATEQANEAKNDAQDAQQDAIEAKQEGEDQPSSGTIASTIG